MKCANRSRHSHIHIVYSNYNELSFGNFSFVEEFATDPNEGVVLLLDLLKIYRRGNQQEHLGHPLTLRNNKDRQQIIKKNMVSYTQNIDTYGLIALFAQRILFRLRTSRRTVAHHF